MTNATRTSIHSGTYGNEILTEDTLRKFAPAIFNTDTPSSKCSDKYQMFSTIDVVRELGKNGWHPVNVAQTKSKDEERLITNKHMVRFRHADFFDHGQAKVGEQVPEIVLLNAHNRGTAYQLHAGMFRFACANGMVVADAMFQARKFRHTPKLLDEVVAATDAVIEEVPRLVDNVRSWNGLMLKREESLRFAKAAHEIAGAPTIEPEQLLERRRDADKRASLWNVFNVVQENIMRGGLEGKTANGRKTKTRGLNNVRAIVNKNKDLWELAEQTYAAKKAA